MTNKQNSEPAFPRPPRPSRPPRPLSVSTGAVYDQQGISLRDYFAAKAIQGICASGPGSQWSNEMLSQEAYRLADAMLAQREKKE